jgi:hypothetical protein
MTEANVGPMDGRKKKTRNSGKGNEKKVMKHRAVTSEDAVNRQVRPEASKNQSTGIKGHPITGHGGPKVELRCSSTLS